MTLFTLRRCAAFFTTLAIAGTVQATPAASHPAFRVDVTGKGAPVILIPGLASSGEVWQATVARLCGPAQRRQCHVLSLAGFAGVAPIAGDLLAQAENQLAAYISDNQLGRPAIIGHSLGGFLALKLAIDHPQQAGKLVIVDALPALGAVQLPSITPEQLQGMAAQMRGAMRAQDDASFAQNQRRSVAGMASRPDDVARITDWGTVSDRSTVIETLATIIGTDLRQDVARIASPTLVLGTWIAYKDYAPRAATEATFQSQYQKLPGVRMAIADTARHFIMYDDPDWLHASIEQFLE
ncbi:alpha/beta fold hydrolase [Janthinobacterium sp. PC23-8]|uniref:alpha/beta fold hydrolase n=1 Tax=Janthinobacterium sp. PC23-8 TaxID=2012679 RepID=UPI000B96DFD8|nr:alpha/beta hydrolase [Janthinobacterium sp. PC23-8]OYO26275.1 alpha/beta hydrolase [Janthinobacterium sp. PC23-8]